ncbi:MAG: molecular chaperone HtpG [Rhodanobacteraceae bacterium]|nr:molecular chaperone HtpG [Rhodanobacteraceae bacterium]MBK7043515.1 molecular chaperone HtpG [Rhodanobacteraceae bacterium]MBP9153877.1 molecular chaperone HtpG [Xanthomonadales bacterium]HQW81686.1 molecular chaperone HtpG [Pseudomonadota bacterium]
MTATDTSATETRRFEAEVEQVLKLVTHSLYSHKEIFLRELVSNASDALDKLRFEAIAKPELTAGDTDLHVEISFDKTARTLTLRDNGIGMSRDEVIENIGTIARSGTRRFLDALTGDARKDTQLIGQFGVGFYSTFVVADSVTLVTRRADLPAEAAVRWTSAGTSDYALDTVTEARRGTTITLHLKPEEDEFLDAWKLRSLVGKYSDHIAFPIRMAKEKHDDDAETADVEIETINHASALWARPKSELSDSDYTAFYKHAAHAYDEPLAWTHNRVEGNQSYTSLLYLPTQAPYDMAFSGRDERKGLKLYIRRVFIMDASEHLLPAYLRFVRGVIDSDDLPLNVSREILQENKLVAQIRSGLTKRTLDLIESLATDHPEKFATFWSNFGAVLKEGVAEDHGNRERIAKLLRFASTKGEASTTTVSLDDYIARMKDGQDTVYYITADTFAAAAGSPQIEALKARDVEVLLMGERIDEWMMGYLHEYAGKKLRNVAKGELDLSKLGAVDEAGEKEADAAAKPVVERIKTLLGAKVKDVRASKRLTESASCIVVDEYDMAPHLKRMLKAAGQDIPDSAPALEINAQHALVQRVANEADEDLARDIAVLLLEQAQLLEGAALDDPAAFVKRMNALIAR